METKTNLDGETMELNSAPNTMTCDFIQTLVNNYRKNHLVSINETLGIQDAHSIHFDLATLKKFIADIETETQRTHPDASDKDLGIRFYYAAYPKATEWDIMKNTPIETEYAERHTLVMVPTMKMADENGEIMAYDFDPMGKGKDGEMLAMASARIPKLQGKVISQNHGTLNPPNATKVEQF